MKKIRVSVMSKYMFFFWSVPLILLIVLIRLIRLGLESNQIEGQKAFANIIWIIPWLVAVFSVLIVFLVSVLYLILKKRKGLETLQALQPSIIFLITILICMLIDGKAIILYFTDHKLPFFPVLY